jgi:hypothetical protein
MATRARIEKGEGILELRLRAVAQLFDSTDHAPFRERALDRYLVEDLMDSARDVRRANRLRIVIRLAEECVPAQIEGPMRAHFAYELGRIRRRRGEEIRIGWIALAIAVVAVIAVTGIAELVAAWITGTLGAGLREALVISGWVLMWRPIELLVYDGIGSYRDRRVLERLASAAIEIHPGDPTAEPSPDAE